MAINLGDLERDLNEDEKLQSRFLSDPVSTLEERGIVLNDDMQQRLIKYVDALKRPDQNVAGASVARDEQAREVGIGISIGKSF